ncbi:MAG: hypothetical protein ACLTMP_10000 [Eggerthella lenta]
MTLKDHAWSPHEYGAARHEARWPLGRRHRGITHCPPLGYLSQGKSIGMDALGRRRLRGLPLP